MPMLSEGLKSFYEATKVSPSLSTATARQRSLQTLAHIRLIART
jgi:hypothetical protein